MITENKSSYYDILEVSTSASQQDILLAYQKAMLTYSSSNTALRSTFSETEIAELKQMVEEAFVVLSQQRIQPHIEFYEPPVLNLNSISSSAEIIEDIPPIEVAPEVKTMATQAEKADTEIKADVEAEHDADFDLEIQNCIEWSGAFLKKVREYKKVSIEQLQESTKVNPWYLRALESMDSQNLPATVFVRGYVIQLAKELGLDDKKVADSYMKIYKEKLEHAK